MSDRGRLCVGGPHDGRRFAADRTTLCIPVRDDPWSPGGPGLLTTTFTEAVYELTPVIGTAPHPCVRQMWQRAEWRVWRYTAADGEPDGDTLAALLATPPDATRLGADSRAPLWAHQQAAGTYDARPWWADTASNTYGPKSGRW